MGAQWVTLPLELGCNDAAGVDVCARVTGDNWVWEEGSMRRGGDDDSTH